MTFDDLLQAILTLLKRQGRLSTGAIKRRFDLDDSYLEDLKGELLYVYPVIDDDGRGLIWNGDSDVSDDIDAQPENALGPEAERRQLTVMFCDLVGSTHLSGQLDPEDLRRVVLAYQEMAAEVITQYDGYMAQYLGDGLLIYFGYPMAHEDDAARAVHSGLGMVEALSALNRRLIDGYHVQLAIRIGIHTGLVVVGQMGGGSRHENLALGETPNIAARIEGLAEPNTVVISAATARLVQDSFCLWRLGAQNLKGVAEPMALSRVLGPAPSHHTAEDGATLGIEALVGRDEEFGLLLRRWEQSQAGLGQVVLISGEPGIGKSSLVGALRESVRQGGVTPMAFRCSPYATNSALYPIIEYLQHALDWQSDDAAESKLTKLEQGVQDYGVSDAYGVQLLAALLSLSLPEDRYPTLAISPEQQRQLTQEILVEWILAASERQPMLAVWEDLHWCDPSTLDVLGLLIDQVPTAAMLHVLTFRLSFEPTWPRRSHITPLALNRLERSQVEALITNLSLGKTLPHEVIEHIVGKTDGVPLFVEELTKMLIESDLLVAESDHYRLTGSLASMSIPSTLQDSLMARLDQLPTAKAVAQYGAVIGREFSYELIQSLDLMTERALQEGLNQLIGAELLYQRGRVPQARYQFKHALIQDAAYDSLLRSTRQQIHRQVAQLYEARLSEMVATQPEHLAHHYTEAGCHESAVTYWHRAGQRAAERSEHLAAIIHLRRGLEALSHLPKTSHHIQQELLLHVALGNSLYVVDGYGAPEVEQVYQRARELCQHVGDTPQLFQVLRGLFVFYMSRAQAQAAQEVAEQVRRRAHQQPDVGPRLLGYYLLGVALFLRGHFVEASRALEQAIALYDPTTHRDLAYIYSIDIGVGARGFAAATQWMLGFPDRALKLGQEALSLAQTQAHPFSLVFVQSLAQSFLHQLRREVSATYGQAAVGVGLATDQGFTLYVAWCSVYQGWALTLMGQWAVGIEMLRQGMERAASTGTETFQIAFWALLAEATGEAGQPAEALAMLAEAQTALGRTSECFYEAELYRLMGVFQLMTSTEVPDEAEAHLHQALEIARRQQARSLELRAATDLARLWRRQGKCREAHELLAPIYRCFTEGFDTADLQDAHSLLCELSES